ncbi:hypothetical protein NMY22_g11280 [Coprinellus aureogranulatus]|nr:hypothetical protein NMY22_g11280 [Coprinellus aureogranulatus]
MAPLVTSLIKPPPGSAGGYAEEDHNSGSAPAWVAKDVCPLLPPNRFPVMPRKPSQESEKFEAGMAMMVWYALRKGKYNDFNDYSLPESLSGNAVSSMLRVCFSIARPLLPVGNAISEPPTPTPRTPVAFEKSSVVSTHVGSTPMTHSSQNAADYAKFEVLKRVVLMELGNSIELVDESYAKDLYADIVDDKKIKAAFKKIGYSPRKKYGGGLGRWNEIPDAASKESELYPIFLKITSSVMETLGTLDKKNTRTAVDTHSMHFTHLDNSTHYSKPDISILATGPSFELPYAKPGATKPTIGYTNIAAFMEVKREGDEGTDEDLIQQTGVYSRQLFIQQPNRKFVRTAVLTEHNIRVIHFDRSGARYTPWINFHKDPYTLVRIILGLSSVDEDVLGLDTSIQWTISKEGRKVAGTIKMIDTGMDEGEQEELTFDLLDARPGRQVAKVTILTFFPELVSSEHRPVSDNHLIRLSIHPSLLGSPGMLLAISVDPTRTPYLPAIDGHLTSLRAV